MAIITNTMHPALRLPPQPLPSMGALQGEDDRWVACDVPAQPNKIRPPRRPQARQIIFICVPSLLFGRADISQTATGLKLKLRHFGLSRNPEAPPKLGVTATQLALEDKQ